MLAFFLAAISVSAAFEGGALRSHEWLSPTHLVATIPGQSDQDNRNHQPSWFYFSLSGVKGQTLTLDLAGFEGEYNYRPHDGRGHRNTRPAFSYNNKGWQHFAEAEWLENPSRLRLRFTAREDTIWIARIPPYTLKHVDQLLARVRQHPHSEVREIGRSVEKRPLHLVSITDPAAPAAAKKHVWIVARQHAWEAGVSWAFEGAINLLLSDTPEARRLRATHVYSLVPTLDPDGLVHGGVRFNRHGYDLNRNWDVRDPAKMPEIAALEPVLCSKDNKIDLFIDLHNTESADFLQGPLTAGGPAIRSLGDRLNRHLVQHAHFNAAAGVRDYPAETPAKGRYSIDHWVFKQTGAPAFLLELMVDTNPRIGRPPHTNDRLAFGAELIRAIAAAL